MKYCTNCGADLINSSKFCGECGQKIEHDVNLKPKKEDIENSFLIPVKVFDNDRTIDPEVYLSTFVDNETTFLGHDNIINHINTKREDYKKFFYENFLEYFNEYLLNSLNYLEEKVKISDIKYNFMYYYDANLLLVFSYKDVIGTFITADGLSFGYLWESQKGLKVLKEKKSHAIVLIFDEEEDEDFDDEFPPQAELRLSSPKSGLFGAPWKFKFTDIVNAMIDARKEYLLLRI